MYLDSRFQLMYRVQIPSLCILDFEAGFTKPNSFTQGEKMPTVNIGLNLEKKRQQAPTCKQFLA